MLTILIPSSTTSLDIDKRIFLKDVPTWTVTPSNPQALAPNPVKDIEIFAGIATFDYGPAPSSGAEERVIIEDKTVKWDTVDTVVVSASINSFSLDEEGGAAVNWVTGDSEGFQGVSLRYVTIKCGVVAWGDEAHIMRVGFNATVVGTLDGHPRDPDDR